MFHKKLPKLQFQVIFTVHEVRNVSLTSGEYIVQYKFHGLLERHHATPFITPIRNRLPFNHSFEFEVEMEVDKDTALLKPFFLTVDLKRKTTKSRFEELIGTKELDLAFHADHDQRIKSTVFQKGKSNEIMDFSIVMTKLSGVEMYRVPVEEEEGVELRSNQEEDGDQDDEFVHVVVGDEDDMASDHEENGNGEEEEEEEGERKLSLEMLTRFDAYHEKESESSSSSSSSSSTALATNAGESGERGEGDASLLTAERNNSVVSGNGGSISKADANSIIEELLRMEEEEAETVK